MISISNDASVSKWTSRELIAFASKKDMRWIQVLDDTSMTIHKQYKISFWPNAFLIDPSGKVVRRNGLRGNELMQSLSAVFPK
jgi:hypothetical protein